MGNGNGSRSELGKPRGVDVTQYARDNQLGDSLQQTLERIKLLKQIEASQTIQITNLVFEQASQAVAKGLYDAARQALQTLRAVLPPEALSARDYMNLILHVAEPLRDTDPAEFKQFTRLYKPPVQNGFELRDQQIRNEQAKIPTRRGEWKWKKPSLITKLKRAFPLR